ncbi:MULTISPECIES: adenylosuccinate synthase [unclassified Neochlamydia]|uniref:adenylosuccinate synthase n=1 Tax=unclassified Neochlamydia TaxID=2643326 RepID=UPI00140C59D2|nr:MULTISPECIES: adenylosuccinate synthase [unclassified Neochlamydia]MBS4167286.1 Adenylosuccinate synthetase [Neochlamydia sp. AcF65]MBS4169700.1 Adenylosuccinate synthetase [Neochlamydia sp. AcF95]NGY95151.1 Adenylosuccinate synthetase [Neochlamydia sp. AcF84]
MPQVILIGAQWGDEDKSKIIDMLTAQVKHVIRSQGGNNAGHTVVLDQQEYKFHLISSAILHSHTHCYIGAGTVIDPEVLLQEMEDLESKGVQIKGRLLISPSAHIIFPYHQMLDFLLEQKKGERAIGTTGRGIGPCYADKAQRLGIRMGELVRPDIFGKLLKSILQVKNEELTKLFGVEKLNEEEIYKKYSRYAELLKPFVAEVEGLIHQAIDNKENILFEGAQGTFLDTSLGTYPYVTSSSTIAGGICAGAGVGPTCIDHTLGVVKAYTTRVGNGPFPTEFQENESFLNHPITSEYSNAVGRRRRIGWFDAVLTRTAVHINGIDSLAVTQLNRLDYLDSIKVCVGYQIHGVRINHIPYLSEDLDKIIPIYETMPGWNASTSQITTYKELPQNAQKYLSKIEQLCRAPINIISLGPQREKTLILKDLFSTKEKAACKHA